jgi:acetyl esterase
VKLHPDAAAVLAKVRAAGVPQWHTLDPMTGRDVYRKRAAMFEGVKPDCGDVEDVTIPGPAGDLALRVYCPPGPSRPIFIYLHGGGWTLGDLDSHDTVCRRISIAADCQVVSVDYRLGPEDPYPAPMDDAVAAIRWIAEHGAELGGDPTRLALGGDSAGANMTAGAVLRLRDEGGPRVALQALIYGAFQPQFEMLSFHENAEGYFLTTKDVQWFWDNYLGPDPAARTDPYACPGTAVDLSDLPPAVVITGDFDPLRDDGDIYAIRLREAGVPVVAKRFPGMIHGFVALPVEIPSGRQAIALIAREARKAWGHPATPATRKRGIP